MTTGYCLFGPEEERTWTLSTVSRVVWVDRGIRRTKSKSQGIRSGSKPPIPT